MHRVETLNYFAHAVRFLDRPYFLAGLAIPDWLSVVDRSVRVRSRQLQSVGEEFHELDREIVAGILQHLEDDRWFHATPTFYTVTGQVGGMFREQLAGDVGEGWPYGSLGHLATELLLDSALFSGKEVRLHDYYAALGKIDERRVANLIERVTQKSVPNLARFIELFRTERFLFDYRDDERLLYRLNQVMRRVGLPRLPSDTRQVLPDARRLVAGELENLLPVEVFGPLPQ